MVVMGFHTLLFRCLLFKKVPQNRGPRMILLSVLNNVILQRNVRFSSYHRCSNEVTPGMPFKLDTSDGDLRASHLHPDRAYDQAKC